MGKDLRVVSDTIRTNRSLIPPPPSLFPTPPSKKKKNVARCRATRLFPLVRAGGKKKSYDFDPPPTSTAHHVRAYHHRSKQQQYPNIQQGSSQQHTKS